MMISTMTTFYFRRISGEKRASILSLRQCQCVQKALFFGRERFIPSILNRSVRLDEILKYVVNICGCMPCIRG